MSIKELSREAMALPLAERVALAQALWQSIAEPAEEKAIPGDAWAIEEEARRDSEISSGKTKARTHEQVMQAARKALE